MKVVRPRAEDDRLAENRTLRNSEENETNPEVCDSIAMAKTRVYIGTKRESSSFVSLRVSGKKERTSVESGG